MKTFLRGLLYCVIIAALFLIGLHAVSVGNGEVDQAADKEPAYTFDSEEELHDYVQDYMEELYAADQAETDDWYHSDQDYDLGYADGYGTGYDDGYLDGYYDCAAGVPLPD